MRESYPAGHDMQGFFLGAKFFERALPNGRLLNWDELAGVVRSASYMPQEGHLNFVPMMNALRELFLKHEENGRVPMNFTTHIYFGQLPRSTG